MHRQQRGKDEMSSSRAVGALLAFLAVVALNTCEIQFNQSKGLVLRIIVPNTSSRGSRNILTRTTNARDIAGPSGSNVQVMILSSGATYATSGPIATAGKTSIDVSFVLPPSGSYQALAQLMDSSGNILSEAQTPFQVPSATNPIALTLPSNLYSVAITDSNSVQYALTPPFAPIITTYSGTSPAQSAGTSFSLTLTTVDPSATFSVAQTDGAGNYPILQAGSPSGSVAVIPNRNDGYYIETVTIPVASAGGATTQTYTMTLSFSSAVS